MSLLKRIESKGNAPTAPLTVDLEDNGAAPPPSAAATPTSRLTTALAQPRDPAKDAWNETKSRVQNKLIAELDPKLDLSNTAQVRRTIEDMFLAILEEENIILPRVDRTRLFEQIAADILGYGPIEPLLKDETVT